MKIRNAKRILCLMLVFVMLLSMLVACKKDEEETGGEGEDTTTTVDENGQRFDENGYLMDDLPEDLDYGGKDITFLVWQESNWDKWELDPLNLPTPLDREVYRRNVQTEKRLNIKLNFEQTTGYNQTMNEYMTKVETIHNSADGTVHGYACYSQVASSLMLKGMSVDLLSTKYFDAEKPWWAPQLIENGTINGRLYYATGDIAPSYLANGFVMYFNKEMANNSLGEALNSYGVSSLYELVEKGQWTIDVMIEFAQKAAVDDGSKDINDQLGYVAHGTCMDAFYQASGMTVLDVANDGSYIMSDDLGSTKTHSLLQRLSTFVLSPAAGYKYNADEVDWTKVFKSGNALFESREFYHALNFKTIAGLNFGVLPMPKYEASQENYYSTNAFTFTLYNLARCLPIEDYDMVSAVMECLASEGYRRSADALFEVMLKAQTSQAAEDFKMWDIIKQSVIIDAGRLHSDRLNDFGWSLFRNPLIETCKSGGSVDYMSYFNNSKNDFTEALDELNGTAFMLEDIYG